MSRARGSYEEQQATDLVNEFLDREMVPEDCIGDVKVHMASDEPMQALEVILEAR